MTHFTSVWLLQYYRQQRPAWSLEHIQTSSVYSCFLNCLFIMASRYFIHPEFELSFFLSAASCHCKVPWEEIIQKTFGTVLGCHILWTGQCLNSGREGAITVVVVYEGDSVHYYQQLYTRTHTHTHVHTHIHTHTYTYTHIHTHAHTRTCTHTRAHTHMYTVM